MTRRFGLAILRTAAALAVCSMSAAAHAQCFALPGGSIRYCSPFTRSLSASRVGLPTTASFSDTGVWTQHVVAYDSGLDLLPGPTTTSMYAGGGYAWHDTILAPDRISGTILGIAWDGNQGWSGQASASMSIPFNLAGPSSCAISGTWMCSTGAGPLGDGAIPTVRFTLSGPAGTVYTTGYSNDYTYSGTLAYQGVLPAGSYTLTATAGNSFYYLGMNLGGRRGSMTLLFALCPADFDLSGTLNVQDIFSFLNAWFAGDQRTDFNGNGAISVADIFDYLQAWFVGC